MKISEWKRNWLADYSWDIVCSLNEELCKAKSADHSPSSDGYKEAQEKWISQHESITSVFEVASFCREMHKISPFCFYNGNTFAAIVRDVSVFVLEKLEPEAAYILKSTLSHFVAGTIDEDDLLNVLNDLPEIE